ncbi:hypothetical protein NDU88_005087 [Pleurodeles waltl]|uniref:Uncharacterized protein n=1 Tax=Pleurodeles waltl TaxID=8319 RepID=A0AAV7M8Z6_PLEWA|nr:hypothetical protein NDU88_005087 [Pleurodeles waltl]
MIPDFTAEVQAKRASYLEVKKVLHAEGIRYSLLFPSKLKIMLDGHSHLCQAPDKALAWLESHTSGLIDHDLSGPLVLQRRRKRRSSRDRVQEEGMTKPTLQQVIQEKRAALQAAASLTESGHSGREKSDNPDVPESEDASDLDSMVSTLEGAPHMMLQTTSDRI